MSAYGDDTALDALSAQVRGARRLSAEQLVDTMRQATTAEGDQERRAATERIVESFLAFTLDEAVARRSSGVDVAVLYQEGAIAVAAAVAESLKESVDAPELVKRVGRDLQNHLDSVVRAEDELRKGDAAVLSDVRLVSALRTRMRADKGEEPTAQAMADVLKWPAERVEALLAMLSRAEAEHDLDILEYLDDA